MQEKGRHRWVEWEDDTVKASETTLSRFHPWSVVLYAQVTKVKRGQADFIYELSQDVRHHTLTHEDNRGVEQKWVQKIICKSPVDKKPSPLASVQDTAEEISAMSPRHTLGSGQRPLSVLHGSWTSLLSRTVSLPSWWTLLSWAYLRILPGQSSLLHCSLGNTICSD